MRTVLCDLGDTHHTDKFYDHKYTEHYHYYLNSIRDKVENLLEVGIWKGESLRMWRDYFTKAEIFGIDIDSTKLIQEDRIQSYCIDQSDITKIMSTFMPLLFDIIIDDGCHYIQHQQVTFVNTFYMVKPGGYYILEDLHTSIEPGKRILYCNKLFILFNFI